MDYEIHGTLNNADIIHNNGFFVGNHHYSLNAELDYLVETLGEII